MAKLRGEECFPKDSGKYVTPSYFSTVFWTVLLLNSTSAYRLLIFCVTGA